MNSHVARLSTALVASLAVIGWLAANSGESRLAYATNAELPLARPANVHNDNNVAFLESAAETNKLFVDQVNPLVGKYCIACHNDKKVAGGLTLEPYKDEKSAIKDRKIWEAVRDVVKSKEMPPKGKPAPSDAERKTIADWIESSLTRVDCGKSFDPGRPTIRRLNRTEYNNTIRDLTGVNFQPAEDFPTDDIGYGFDNIGDVLSMPPILLEKYMAAAEKILDTAIVVEKPITSQKDTFRPQNFRTNLFRQRNATPQRSFPLTSNGKVFVEFEFLYTGEYIIRGRAYGEQAGDELPKMAIQLDRKEIKTFDVEVLEGKAKVYEVRTKIAAGRHNVELALTNHFEEKDAKEPQGLKEPKDLKKGEAKEAKEPKVSKEPRDLKKGEAKEAKEPKVPKEPKDLKKGEAKELKGPKDSKELNETKKKARNLYVELLEIEGPFNPVPKELPESHKRIMIAKPAGKDDREAAAQTIIETFATKAYRRPVRTEEVARLLKLFKVAEGQGDPFEKCVALALRAVLVSPNFLFRIEKDAELKGPATVHPVTDFELATRLSYFLWSTMPDAELFDLASKKMLRKPGVIEAQVKRMLADPKSHALTDNFASQWLNLRMIDSLAPDGKTYPNFDSALKTAMVKETELFFEHIVKEDRSVLEFLDSDWTFLNGRLAKHYGISGVYGNDFRKVKLTDKNRGGVVSQASILTLTSNPTRTSPVKRGKWILENILGTPPPPPPPDVPELKEEKQGALTGSLRQRMEQHRANPACATCHQKMDPLGFGLENFDGIGGWRSLDGKFKIDSSGTLPGGEVFNGPAELRKVLLRKSDLFRRNLSEKLLTYALGRGLEYYDKCAVDELEKTLKSKNDKFSALVIAIVNSDPFQKRRGAGKE